MDAETAEAMRYLPEASAEATDKVVLIAREASVMELFAVDVDQLAGVIVEHGGAQSHAAILARSLNIPMVGQVSDFAALLHPGRRLLIDGTKGVVTLDPPADAVVPASLGRESVRRRGSSHGRVPTIRSSRPRLGS